MTKMISSDKPRAGALSSFTSLPAWLALPPFDMVGRRVLDIGCGNGKDLTHPVYANALERIGLDPDDRSLFVGRKKYPDITFVKGAAEALPFPTACFDVVTSRVALPYTELGAALREIGRVTKPDGYICLTLHDWHMHWRGVKEAILHLSWKHLADVSYVAAASAWFTLAARVPARPWNGTYETFQIIWKMRRTLTRLGFEQIEYERGTRDCLMTARKSPVTNLSRPERASDRFRSLMREASLTETETAQAFGVKELIVRQWCSGKQRVPRMAFLALERLAADRNGGAAQIRQFSSMQAE